MKVRDLFRRWTAMTFWSKELAVEDPELQSTTLQLFDGRLQPMSTLAGPVSIESLLPEEKQSDGEVK